MSKTISFHYIFISLEPSASAIVCICIMYVHYILLLYAVCCQCFAAFMLQYMQYKIYTSIYQASCRKNQWQRHVFTSLKCKRGRMSNPNPNVYFFRQSLVVNFHNSPIKIVLFILEKLRREFKYRKRLQSFHMYLLTQDFSLMQYI